MTGHIQGSVHIYTVVGGGRLENLLRDTHTPHTHTLSNPTHPRHRHKQNKTKKTLSTAYQVVLFHLNDHRFKDVEVFIETDVLKH